MTRIPAPSPQIVHSLREVVEACAHGDRERAACMLLAGTAAIAAIPSMLTDVYHLANAAIGLGLQPEIGRLEGNEQLLLAIEAISSGEVLLTGSGQVEDPGRDLDRIDGKGSRAAPSTPAERLDAVRAVDLDDFTPLFLRPSAQILLHEGIRLYMDERPADALAWLRAASRVAQHLDLTELLAACLFYLGYTVHALTGGTAAEPFYADALRAAERGSERDRRIFGEYMVQAAKYFQAEGNDSMSREYLRKALCAFEQAGDEEGARDCRTALGRSGQNVHERLVP